MNNIKKDTFTDISELKVTVINFDSRLEKLRGFL